MRSRAPRPRGAGAASPDRRESILRAGLSILVVASACAGPGEGGAEPRPAEAHSGTAGDEVAGAEASPAERSGGGAEEAPEAENGPEGCGSDESWDRLLSLCVPAGQLSYDPQGAPSGDPLPHGGDLVRRGGEPAVVPGAAVIDPSLGSPVGPHLRAFLAALFDSAPDRQNEMIDWERQTRIVRATRAGAGGSGPRPPQHRRGLPVSLPEGCEPAFVVREGYDMLAMPPPMVTMSDELTATVERAIEHLRAGVEVIALCSYRVELPTGLADRYGDDVYEEKVLPRPALILNVYRSEQGYRVQAFSEMDGQMAGAYPDS